VADTDARVGDQTAQSAGIANANSNMVPNKGEGWTFHGGKRNGCYIVATSPE